MPNEKCLCMNDMMACYERDGVFQRVRRVVRGAVVGEPLCGWTNWTALGTNFTSFLRTDKWSKVEISNQIKKFWRTCTYQVRYISRYLGLNFILLVLYLQYFYCK